MKRVVFYTVAVLFILLILGFSFSGTQFSFGEGKNKSRSASEIEALSSALKAYYVDNGKFLAGDNASITRGLGGDNPQKAVYISWKGRQINDRGEFIDPWGHPYRFDLQNPKGPRIWSIGPQGKDAPDDPASGDICSWR